MTKKKTTKKLSTKPLFAISEVGNLAKELNAIFVTNPSPCKKASETQDEWLNKSLPKEAITIDLDKEFPSKKDTSMQQNETCMLPGSEQLFAKEYNKHTADGKKISNRIHRLEHKSKYRIVRFVGLLIRLISECVNNVAQPIILYRYQRYIKQCVKGKTTTSLLQEMNSLYDKNNRKKNSDREYYRSIGMLPPAALSGGNCSGTVSSIRKKHGTYSHLVAPADVMPAVKVVKKSLSKTKKTRTKATTSKRTTSKRKK